MFESTLFDEIAEIEDRAFEMASSVARNSSLRATLGRESVRLVQRLTEILTEIETVENSVYAKLCYRISEAMKDLIFVEKDSAGISNRLARELSRQRDY